MNSPVTPTDAHKDASARFLSRLMTSVRLGHRLDDPRNVDVLERWVAICNGLPDGALLTIIPRTLRALLRQPDTLDQLINVCGVSPHHPLQHESIAPYIISYRRYQASRGRDPRNEQAKRAIEGLRAELRALRQQFNGVFDQMADLEQERERLTAENEALKAQVQQERSRADEAEKRLLTARDKALRLFRLYLYMLKEERGRLSNDPRRERLLTAEIAVESHAATLEALGFQQEAEDHAHQILGDLLFTEYFHSEDRQAASALRRPNGWTPEPQDPAYPPPPPPPEPTMAPPAMPRYTQQMAPRRPSYRNGF